MWQTLCAAMGPHILGVDGIGGANAFRGINTAATSVSANQKLVQEKGVQTGEQIVVANASSALQQLDTLSKDASFKDSPEIKTATEVLTKVKNGEKISPDDIQKLMKAAASIEQKLLPIINQSINTDIKANMADGKLSAEEEKGIEDKYKKLGVDVNILNADERKEMASKGLLSAEQASKGVAFSVASLGGAEDPVKTFSGKVQVDKQGPPKQGLPEYEPLDKKAVLEPNWTDPRYTHLKSDPNFFIHPNGGIQVSGDPDKPGGVIKKTLPNGQPTPSLQDAIKEDFSKVREKFSSAQDLQAAVKAGFGVTLSNEDATKLYNYMQHGKADPNGPAPTRENVRELQRILASLSDEHKGAVLENGGFDGLYGYATTKEVRMLGAVLDQVKKQEPKPTVVSEQIDVVGLNVQTQPKTWKPNPDANYLVDVSGSMNDTARNLFNLIDKSMGVSKFEKIVGLKDSSKENVSGKFSGGDGTITGVEKGNLSPAERKAAVNKVIGDAFTSVVGKPPSEEKLQQFATMFNLPVDQLKACVKNGELDVKAFRTAIKDPPGGAQESGLKSALVTMLTNEQYSKPLPGGKQHELCVATDEPEHSAQYLELVKFIAEQKGIDVKIIALPTSMGEDGNANRIENKQKQLDDAILDLQKHKANPKTAPSLIQNDETRIARLQKEIDALSIHVIDLSTVDASHMRSNSTQTTYGLEFKWTNAQETMGTTLVN